MPVFPPAAPVTIFVDGRPLPAYFRAFVAGGRVFAPLVPVLRRLADRAWFEGETLVIERDGRRVRVLVAGPDRVESTFVSIGPLLRGLGDSVAYDARRRQVDVRTVTGSVGAPTPYDAGAPQASPLPVFTPEPIATPRPQWSGQPLPRRTPLPAPPRRFG